MKNYPGQHWGSPPLARGILYITNLYRMPLGITPACAGNTPLVGDDLSHMGSPPLARGIRDISNLKDGLYRITPACAGNTYCLWSVRSKDGDHPRLRGEYNADSMSEWLLPGSPPLARGILPARLPEQENYRITPACAGNTLQVPFLFVRNEDHPRLRGEYLN